MCSLPKYFSEKELQFEKVRYTVVKMGQTDRQSDNVCDAV